MKIVSDVGQFSKDKRFQGFLIMSIVTALLIISTIYFITAPQQFVTHAVIAGYVIGVCCVLFIFVLAVYLKSKGMLFKVPLKFYDDRLLIQPVLGLRPSVIFYKDIASLELWTGISYRKTVSGCSVLSSDKSITSVELFRDNAGLRSIAEAIRPYLEKNDLKLATVNDEAGSLQYVFHRDVRPRRTHFNL